MCGNGAGYGYMGMGQGMRRGGEILCTPDHLGTTSYKFMSTLVINDMPKSAMNTFDGTVFFPAIVSQNSVRTRRISSTPGIS